MAWRATSPLPKEIGYHWVRYPNPRESWRPKTGSSGLYSPSSAALQKFHTPANKVFWFYLISFTLFNRSQPVVESKFSKVSRQLRTVPIKNFKTVLSDSTLDSDLHFKLGIDFFQQVENVKTPSFAAKEKNCSVLPVFLTRQKTWRHTFRPEEKLPGVRISSSV